MIKNILSLALLYSLLSVPSVAISQENNIIRSNIGNPTRMFIPANSNVKEAATVLDENGDPLKPEPIQFTITSGQYQLPEGTVTLADGTVLNAEQKGRLQDVIDNNMHEYLGYRVDAVAPLLPHLKSSYFYRHQFFDLPTEFAIDMQVSLYIQPSTWGGDSDRARFFFDARKLDDTVVTSNMDTGQVNWSSKGWAWAGDIRSYDRVLGSGTHRVRFFGSCHRVSGSYCSAVINQAYMITNADLPKLGETVSIQPPAKLP